MEALFEIFDFDNDGYFGIEDLITLLRTFETQQIVPELKNSKSTSRIISDDSDENTEADTDSSRSIKTLDSSCEIPTYELESLPYISSHKMKKIARNMFTKEGFTKNAFLSLESFSTFMRANPCFTKQMVKSVKGKIWMDYATGTSTKSMIDSVPQEFENVTTGTDFSLSDSDAVLSGVLKKKGRKSGNMKKRYYVLKGNVLYYYLRKGDQSPRGVMYLPNKLMSQDHVKGKF